MIMTKKEDGTYKQVGFIYRNDEIDVSGEVPVDFKIMDGIIGDYKIKGNAYQSDGVSPDTPQEVKAVGDRTGNLFDKNTITAGSFATVSGTTANKNYYCSDFIPITATTYYFQNAVGGNYQHTVVVYDANEQGLRYANLPGSDKVSGAITFQSGDAYIRINCYYQTQTDADTVMVNIGSTALSYEPYGYKIPVVTRGKNLWYLQSSYSFTTFYNINVNINAGHYLSYIIETNGTTGSQGETGCQLTFSDNTTQYVLFNANYRTSIFLSKDVKIVRVYAGKDYNTSIGATATVSKIMVSANADDSYEPYHEPITTPIYLDSPLYKIGDYADFVDFSEQKVERAVKELVLTGEETFLKNEAITNAHAFALYDFNTPYIYKIGLCTHFTNTTVANTTGNNIYFDMKIHLFFDLNSEITTDAVLLTWLKEQYTNGTPVKIYYVLATPETESVTLPKIPTLDGTNIIDINTEIKPSNISLSRPMTEIKKILNKEGKILFEKGFTREVESILPLTLNGINKPLKSYTIYGNTLQNGTPTPKNPVEVQGVGDRTTNLFDILTVYSDTTKFTINKNSVTATGCNFDAKRIKLADVGVGIGDAFVFSANILNSVTGVMGRVCASIGGVIKQGFYKNILEPYVSSITGTMETNEDAIWISYGDTGEINASNIMLNSGSTALPYEPYGYKIPVVTRGNNLLGNYELFSGYYYDSSGTPSDADNRFIRCSPINIKAETNYAISSNLRFHSIWKFKNNQAIEKIPIDNKNVFVFNTGTDCNRIGISLHNTSGKADTSAFEWIQLEEGTTATPYEPYHEPITTPIYLDSPLYKIGDYADRLSKTKEVRIVKELVLTGTDVDGNWTASPTRKGSFYFYLKIGANAVAGRAICDRATNADNINNYRYGNVFVERTKDFLMAINLWLFDTAISLAYFKAYLAAQYAAGTPVKVYYVMQTPETKPVEPVEIPTLNGTTVIDVDTAVKPTEMYTKYKSSK